MQGLHEGLILKVPVPLTRLVHKEAAIVLSRIETFAHQLKLPMHFKLELGALLLMAVLYVSNEALLVVDLLNELVLEVDHATLQLLELEAVLALDLLSSDVENLRKVTFEHID